MSIFTDILDTYIPLVPTILRSMAPVVIDAETGVETSQNAWNLAIIVGGMQPLQALTQALAQMDETDYPLPTAAGWVLDQHWGPMHNVQRNGGTDAEFRVFVQAKRLLNASWGAADQALDIFALLLPAAGTIFTPYYPKAWTIQLTGVDMAQAAEVLAFMSKKPSPLGGGFSVCGDNGFAIVTDPECFNYSSVYGVIGVDYVVTGWFGSVYGAGGGVQAGYAHVAQI